MNAGQYFNLLICNLKIKGFGVYNCDQVYLIKIPIVINGKYITEDSADIGTLQDVYLIDPKVNAAFNVDPKLFKCSASGDNMLIILTMDNKIYFFDKVKWKAKQIKSSGKYTFEMLDITSQVKTPANLQRILEGNVL